MITFKKLQTEYRDQILEIATLCNAEKIRVFGSVVRGENQETSDVDFLVHMKPNSGFCIGGLQWRLEELLHCPVDIVSDASLNSLIRDKILSEAREL